MQESDKSNNLSICLDKINSEVVGPSSKEIEIIESSCEELRRFLGVFWEGEWNKVLSEIAKIEKSSIKLSRLISNGKACNNSNKLKELTFLKKILQAIFDIICRVLSKFEILLLSTSFITWYIVLLLFGVSAADAKAYFTFPLFVSFIWAMLWVYFVTDFSQSKHVITKLAWFFIFLVIASFLVWVLINDNNWFNCTIKELFKLDSEQFGSTKLKC